MAPPPEQIMRVLVKRWNEGVRSAEAELIHPAIEIESPFSSVAGKPYRGYDGVAAWARDIDEQFSQWRIDVEEVTMHDVRALALATVRVRGRGSDMELSQASAAVGEFAEDGRLARLRIFINADEGRAAVG
jgi:hypothetical protein